MKKISFAKTFSFKTSTFNMKTLRIIKIGRLIALCSFLVGTFIFLFYYFTSANICFEIGFYYVLTALVINIAFLVILSIYEDNNKVNNYQFFKTRLLMLLNIPVMAFYTAFSFALLDIMRITFINQTHKQLTDIQIIGCESKSITKLEIGESKTIWININGGNSIDIEYSTIGKREKESVTGYITEGLGHKMTHTIDDK